MRRATLAMTAATLGIAGCAAHDAPSIHPTGSVEVDAAVDLAAVYPFDLRPMRFSLGGDDDQPTAVVREFRPLPDGRVELIERAETTGELMARVILSRTASGDVVIHETATPARNLLTRFDPPMLFLPSGLAPGERVEQRLRLDTFTLADPPKPKGGGDGTMTISRPPDQARESDLARPWAVIETTLTARVGPARIETTSVYTLEPASDAALGGLRGRSSARTVRVFGLVVERESETLTMRREEINSPGRAESADSP